MNLLPELVMPEDCGGRRVEFGQNARANAFLWQTDSAAYYRRGCELEDLHLLGILVNKPAFAHAVLREPADPFGKGADSRTRGKDFDHEIRRAPDAIGDDAHPRLRDEDDVGLDDEVALPIEDDIDWRHPDSTAMVSSNVVC